MSDGVRAIARPHTASFTTVDPRLRDFFERKNLSVSWQPDNEETMSMLYPQGYRCVQAEDLRDEDPDLYDYITEANYINARGRLQRQDCVLMVQPTAKREEQMELDRFLRNTRESGEKAAEEMEEYLKRTSHSASPHVVSVPDSKDAVSVNVAEAMDLPTVDGGDLPEMPEDL